MAKEAFLFIYIHPKGNDPNTQSTTGLSGIITSNCEKMNSRSSKKSKNSLAAEMFIFKTRIESITVIAIGLKLAATGIFLK